MSHFEMCICSSELPKGTYRKIMVLPTNVSHKIIEYNDTDAVDSFIVSDLDLMKAGRVEAIPTETDEAVQPPKDRKCVVVEFSLPTCSYATMALRELLIGTDDDTDEVSKSGMAEKRTAPVEADGVEGHEVLKKTKMEEPPVIAEIPMEV